MLALKRANPEIKIEIVGPMKRSTAFVRPNVCVCYLGQWSVYFEMCRKRELNRGIVTSVLMT
jgi:hypothetical protein